MSLKFVSKTIFTILAILLIFIGYYISVYKSFSYQSNNQAIGAVIIIICISLIPIIWSGIRIISNWKKYLYAILMTPIAFIVIFITIESKKNHLKNELLQNGINRKGEVIGFEIESRKGRKTKYAKISYEFQNKKLIQRIENKNNEYKLNQKLILNISKLHPEMFEIVKVI
jgi:hypothetical protein